MGVIPRDVVVEILMKFVASGSVFSYISPMTKVSSAYAARARYLPFAVFMAFIGIDEMARFAASQGLFALTATTLYYLYPLKAVVVAALLFHYRRAYTELNVKDLARIPVTLAVVLSGLLVFVLWINMDWVFSPAATPQGFNPTLLPGTAVQLTLTAFRIFGAVLVVPLMEELFWRSFLIRYIDDHDFERVPVGHFSWPSFLITVVLFGLEHHFILAGMLAGILYSIVLYRTRSLAQCILAHAVTNLALALYVVSSGKWYFW